MPPHAHLGYVNPVVDHDFPDPGVFYHAPNRTWYAYSTNSNGKNVQCSHSTDFCSWSHSPHDCLPGPLPAWISSSPGFVWAPEVITAPQNRGGYLMYVSVQDVTTGKQCIGVAYSQASPLGPFYFLDNRPMISRGEFGGCLDPQPFEDPNSGQRYLIFKSDVDRMYTKGPQLWLQKLSEDGLRLEGEMIPLMAPTQPWQGDLLEAPYLTYHGPSRTFCLFYSSGTFTKKSYATSYAISYNGIFGPYQPSVYPLLASDERRGVLGPGGASVVEGVEGHWFIVFHALEHEGGPRRMCVHRLEWNPDGSPNVPARPNCGRRLRLGAEVEDDLEHFGGASQHLAPLGPVEEEASGEFGHPPPPSHHQGLGKILAGSAGLGAAAAGLFGKKKRRKEKKHGKDRSSSSSSSSSSSDSD
ncbi:Arabinanase/levansucrase/invertase [Violaceomyces palustris]|uniref:Arabinanase/levansucrase/invertase n=1 Tax=Violaceomyces palustris TaxID=1673888 RepID=A0ACD0NNC9_9BASI|nr:Arabinanase/levansucrase/invertase [Violaceomyces palustris]